MYLVFCTFKDSLFTDNHIKILFNSKFILLNVVLTGICGIGALYIRVVSSAYIMYSNSVDACTMSFMYNMNNKGPNIDP